MDIQILVSIIGLSGAAILSSAAYFYKSLAESKRSARKVLYYLLEIRYAINTSLIDPKLLYEQYISSCIEGLSKRGIPAKREELEPSVGHYIYNHLVNITDSVKTEIDEKIIAPYEHSLLQLAETDPILAYKLRGKERIQQAIIHTTQYTSTLESEFLPNLPPNTDEINTALKNFSSSQKYGVIKDIETYFNDQIIMVAKSCGLIEYLKCKKALKKPLNQTRNIDASDIDEMLGNVLDNLTAEIAKAHAQPVPTDRTA